MPFRFPKIKVPVKKVPSVPVKLPSGKTVLKTAAVGTGAAVVAYSGYKAAETFGGIADSFNPSKPPVITKKEAATDPNLPPSDQTKGWSPEDWAKFYAATRQPYDPNSPTGFWDRVGEGVGTGIGSVPEGIGSNILPIAVIAGIVLIAAGSKHGKK